MLQSAHRFRAAPARDPRSLCFAGVSKRMMRRSAVVRVKAAAATAVAEAPAADAGSNGYKDAVMVQGFGWDSCDKGGWYKRLEAKIPELQVAGCTHLWLPPPSQSVSPQGYMPGQLYNLNTKYGTKDELVSLNSALKKAGIIPVADIVINHRCADEMVNGKWNKYRDDVDHLGRKLDWGAWAITNNDPQFGGTGNPDTGEDYGPAPDLDHANPDLRAALKDWLLWLQQDIGFGGWRLDFVKGYGANFVPEYLDATVGRDVLSVGEYWVDMEWCGSELNSNQDAARQKLCNWINAASKSCSAFDFPTKGILQEAVRHTQYWRLRDSNGKAPGLLGWWPARAVTFIDNHDTGSTQQHWPFPADRVGAGYAYILTHPGMPCIFYDHLFEWGPELAKSINVLTSLRERLGIVSNSKLDIRVAEADMYFAVVADRIAVKLGPRYDMGRYLPKESDGWKLVASGKEFAVWERSVS